MGNSSTITSTANDHVKYVRSLHRRRSRYREQLFIAEGLRAVEEAIKAGTQPAFLFHTPSVLQDARIRPLVSAAQERGVLVRAVSDPVMLALSGTVTPSGILAVFPMRECSIPHPLTWVLVVDRLRDPGNMGTILRSALAAGIELVITSKGTVDVYSPKVVRAGMGAHFRLQLCLNQSWASIGNMVEGLHVLVAEPTGGVPYWEIDWGVPTALVIGGEARGATSEADQLATGHVTIPMRAGTESLNAAVAASVLLFEGARQRSSCGC
jgi:TrmH family RNA methyltransferase